MLHQISAHITFQIQADSGHECLVGDDALHERARRYARELCDLLEGDFIESSLESRVGIPFSVEPPQKNLL